MIKIYYYGGYRLAYTVVGNRVYDEYGHEEYKIIGKYTKNIYDITTYDQPIVAVVLDDLIRNPGYSGEVIGRIYRDGYIFLEDGPAYQMEEVPD